jgi:glycosyltransferase involved in cell wall biosynthesis
MKIAILNITGGGISGGYKKYLQNVLPLLERSEHIDSILFLAPKTLNERDFVDLKSPKITVKSCKCFSFIKLPFSKLERELDDFGPDIIFVPLERPFFHKNVPTVVMFQNMAPFSGNCFKTSAEDKLRKMSQYHLGKKAAKNATHIIATSNYVKKYIRDTWNISNDRVTAIPFGITPPPSPKKPDALMQTDKFFFTAGTIESYRGLEDIINALSLLGDREMTFVIAGNARMSMKWHFKKLQDKIARHGLQQQIVFTGNLTQEEMAWCYQNARAFVMTSRVEACPNIVLEALANGCVSISVDCPPMPEFFQNAALYYNPGDFSALAKKIRKVSNLNDSERQNISRQAKNEASKYSWQNTTDETISLFKQIVSSKSKK